MTQAYYALAPGRSSGDPQGILYSVTPASGFIERGERERGRRPRPKEFLIPAAEKTRILARQHILLLLPKRSSREAEERGRDIESPEGEMGI